MSENELEAFLSEMEPDIRAADRDMREIEALENKGVTSPGRLQGSSLSLSITVVSEAEWHRQTTKPCNLACKLS
jgi:hypothetical protein